MKTHYLSKEERAQGTRQYLKWATLNGLGFSFLGDTPIYLMALHFGASNLQLGYISSIVHASGLTLLILPRLLAGRNLVTVHFYAWLCRGLLCILYGVLFLLNGQTAVVVILILYTLFCIVRTFGVAVGAPIQQMLATPSTLGAIVVRASNRFQMSRLLSQLLSTLIISVKQLAGMSGYYALILSGVLMNTLASFSIKKVPCREVAEYRRGKNIFAMFARSMRDRELAITLFVKWHALSLGIIFAFIIPFLRKIVGLPPNIIFLFTLTGTVATILGGYLLHPFVDRVGSRPLITLASFLLTLLALFWSIIPPTASTSIFFLLGFLTSFLQGIVTLLVSRLELKSMPEKDKISYVSMMNFFSASIALGVGLFGGKLADLGEQLHVPGINAFGFTFLFAVIIAMQNWILCFFLKDVGSLSVAETANILLSTRNLKTFLDIYQLNMTVDPVKRSFILMSLGKSDMPLATHEMRRILTHPLTPEKEDVLKTLFANPRRELLPDLLREAAEPQNYHRATAIFALGAYPGKETENVLLACLDDPSPRIQSTAAKSLARIGNTSALDRIRTLAADSALGIWERMNYWIAIENMDKTGAYLMNLFEWADPNQGAVFEQTILSLTARILEFDDPSLGDLYQDDNLTPGEGFEGFLEAARPLKPFFDHADWLAEQYAQGQYQELWTWSRTLLAECCADGRLAYLTRAIQEHDLQRIDRINTFAMLYFTDQLLQAEFFKEDGE